MTTKPINPWKYRFGLLLILSVVIIWVASAEVTQLIFERYRHPFLLTWLGASLLGLYLPVSYLKEWLAPRIQLLSQSPATNHQQNNHHPKTHAATEALSNTASGHSAYVPQVQSASGHGKNAAKASTNEVEMAVSIKSPTKPRGATVRSPRSESKAESNPAGEGNGEEGAPLLYASNDDSSAKPHNADVLGTQEIARIALTLAPIWLLTEYLSNAALSMTSVASTTILSSTSGLFTLLFGVTIGGESLTTAKLLAALVSIAGVVMTELGKSTASDDQAVFGDAERNPGETAGQLGLPGHNLIGDICGLLSAVTYGFYTTLLRKWAGGDEGGEEKADMQKLFGFIGLVTFIGLWPLVLPLYWIGWEPVPRMPSSYGLDEDILANGLIGSMISDYFWALSVVWTTPLVATLGLSLTIPLAMVADMVMHGRAYSPVYILGAIGVFGGFLIANAGDNLLSSITFERICSYCPPWGSSRGHKGPLNASPREAASEQALPSSEQESNL